MAVPTAGLDACGVAGSIVDVFSPTGPLTDDTAAATSWPNGNTFSGFAEATSNYGYLSAHSHGQFSGTYFNSNVTGSDAFGIAEDGFAITSPSFANGQSGSVTFHVTVTGAFSTTSSSRFGVQLANRVNNQTYLLFTCNGDSPTLLPSIYSRNGTGLAGFLRSPGAMSGSGVITSDQIPIVFGTSFNYKLGLLTEAVPALSSTVDSDFEAAITGIVVKGPAGQTVTDFVVTSGSGTVYGPGGVSAASEFTPDHLTRITAFPNPARARVELRFGRSMPEGARLAIFDLAGRPVRQLTEAVAPGGQSVSWDGRNDGGVLLPGGLYFARLTSAEGASAVRFTLLR